MIMFVELDHEINLGSYSPSADSSRAVIALYLLAKVCAQSIGERLRGPTVNRTG